jgi:MFS family permease
MLSSFGALRHRNFRLFVIGHFVSLCGTWMQVVALGWLVLTLTDSAFAVGLVAAAGSLPVLLFTLQGGAVADRVNRRRMLLWLQGGMLLEALVLATLAATGHATLPWIVVLALVAGTLTAFEIPIRQAFLMDLVGREDLMNGIALHSMTFNVSRVVGPGLAGLVTAAAGPAVCFFVNAASYLAVLVGLFRIRLDPVAVAPRRQAPPLREALGYIFAPGWPRTLVTLTAVYTIFGMSFLNVLPVYARDVLGTGAAGYGGLTSAFGLGAAGGALLLAAFGSRYRRGEVALRAGLLIGATLAIMALVPDLGVATLLLFLGGAAAAINAVITNTLLQTESPDTLRGRVIGFYSFIVVGLAPFGALQAGWFAEHFGVRLEAAAGGALCLLATLWLSSRVFRFGGPASAERRHGDSAREPYRWGERRKA